MIRRSAAVLVLGLVVTLSACSTPEYTSSEAQRDLVRAGLTSTQAGCVLNGLRAFYADQYVQVQMRFVRQHHPNDTVPPVNPQERDLYVRNKLAGQDVVGNDETAMARRVVSECRRSP